MSCLGVFFGIDEKTVQILKEMDRSDIVEYVQEDIEEIYFTTEQHINPCVEVDKAWDAIQRAFSEGECDLANVRGSYPSNMIILGGEILYGDKEKEDDYIISLKNPTEVIDVYKFLSELSEAEFRELYFKIDTEKYGFDVDEQDFEYTWTWLSGTVPFWKCVSEKNISVIFTVDQ